MRFRTQVSVLLFGLGATPVFVSGCGEEIQPTYGIELAGATPEDLAAATTLVLELGDRELDRRSFDPRRAVSLSATGLDIGRQGSGIFRVRALDAAGNLVAFGQSPEVELSLSQYQFRILIQRPATFMRAADLDAPRKGLIAVTTTATPLGNSTAAPSMAMPFFGFGRVLFPGMQPNETIETLSETLFAFQPLLHEPVPLGPGGVTQGQTSAPRTDAAAVTRDGFVFVFGGLTQANAAMPPRPTAQVDQYRLRRTGFTAVAREVIAARTSTEPEVARSETVLVAAGAIYAIGGRGATGPLDSVVRIDLSLPVPLALLERRMAAPRVAHTATAAMGEMGPEVLIVGGAAAGAPPAEVLVPAPTPMFVLPQGEVGSRLQHAAVELPGGRILVVGGLDEGGTARGDAVVYDPRRRAFEPAPLMLRTARSAFAAFVVGNDLVIAGGRNAQGMVLGNAEIFDASTLAFVAETRAEPRHGAKSTVLPTGMAVVIGGEGQTGFGSVAVEVYQPRRP